MRVWHACSRPQHLLARNPTPQPLSCLANMQHTRLSKPHSGLDFSYFQYERLQNLRSHPLLAQQLHATLAAPDNSGLAYRGTPLVRNSAPLGPYGRSMPRALQWS